MSKIIFFSYGSNMHLPRLSNEKRCPSAKILGVYYLDNYEFAYSKLSTDGSAKANIIPKKGAKVFGLLTAIEDSELTNLRKAEGCRPDGTSYNEAGYSEQNIMVVSLSNNEVIESKVYVSPSSYCKKMPYNWYVKHVVEGARVNGFDDRYIGQYLEVCSENDTCEKRNAEEFAYHSQ